jgi:hypothetical protein
LKMLTGNGGALGGRPCNKMSSDRSPPRYDKSSTKKQYMTKACKSLSIEKCITQAMYLVDIPDSIYEKRSLQRE